MELGKTVVRDVHKLFCFHGHNGRPDWIQLKMLNMSNGYKWVQWITMSAFIECMHISYSYRRTTMIVYIIQTGTQLVNDIVRIGAYVHMVSCT